MCRFLRDVIAGSPLPVVVISEMCLVFCHAVLRRCLAAIEGVDGNMHETVIRMGVPSDKQTVQILEDIQSMLTHVSTMHSMDLSKHPCFVDLQRKVKQQYS